MIPGHNKQDTGQDIEHQKHAELNRDGMLRLTDDHYNALNDVATIAQSTALRKINEELVRLGLFVRAFDGGNNVYYKLTDAGLDTWLRNRRK